MGRDHRGPARRLSAAELALMTEALLSEQLGVPGRRFEELIRSSEEAHDMHHGINLGDKLDQVDEHWAPRTVATFNGHDVMVVRVAGEFVWHEHADTDELFLVLSGRLVIRLHDGDVILDPGELFVIPAGAEHQPFAPEETTVLLLDATGTPNTGDATSAAPRVEI